MGRFVLALSLLFSLPVSANPIIVGTVDHDKNRDFVTVAMNQDGENTCMIATATRHPQGATSAIHCYRSPSAARITVMPTGSFLHVGRVVNR